MSSSGKYRLGRLIGGGGMAEVYEATSHGEQGFARPVAIKRMLPALSLDPSFGQMFVNEAQIAGRLRHENVVSVLDFARDAEGRYFLVMELVSGVDLRKLGSSGPLPLAVVAHIIGEVLAGLAYAHELEHNGRPLGIVHRDMSPHNVMVSWDGAVKVVDFGIAKAVQATGASRSGGLKGKVAYMSPEQAHGAVLDGRSDVFAVGVMLHELLTGQRLFGGATEVEILARLMSQPIPWPRQLRPGLPPDLEAVVMRMLDRDRERRFPSAHAAHEALLATSVVDARAQMQLRELLRERFPHEAPRRRSESEQAFLRTPSGPVPAFDAIGAPLPGTATPLQRPPFVTPMASPSQPLPVMTPSEPIAVSPAMQKSTVTNDPEWAIGNKRVSRRQARVTVDPQPQPQPQPPARSRTGLYIVAAMVFSGVVITVAMVTRGGGDPGGQATAPTDAAARAAVVIDAGPAAAIAAPDAAVAPEVTITAIVVDAGVASSSSSSSSRRDAGSRRDTATPVTRPEASTTAATPPTPADAGAGAAEPAQAEAKLGKIKVTVAPWARVYIDDQDVGSTPVIVDATPGPHEVRIVNENLDKDETSTVTVKPSRTALLNRVWPTD